jgi:hypothetical protein
MAPKNPPTAAINLPHSCTVLATSMNVSDCDRHRLPLSILPSVQTVDNRRNGIFHLRDETTSRDRL